MAHCIELFFPFDFASHLSRHCFCNEHLIYAVHKNLSPFVRQFCFTNCESNSVHKLPDHVSEFANKVQILHCVGL